MDDEPQILDFLGMALRLEGFVVWLASSGAHACTLYLQHRDGIDVTLVDAGMPGADGPQTLAALRAVDPTVRCCFMVGGSTHYTQNYLLAAGAAHVFRKPFTDLAALSEALWQLVRHPVPPQAN